MSTSAGSAPLYLYDERHLPESRATTSRRRKVLLYSSKVPDAAQGARANTESSSRRGGAEPQTKNNAKRLGAATLLHVYYYLGRARAQPAAHSRAQQPRRAVCNGHCGCVTACSTPHSSGAAPAGPKGTLTLTRVYPPSCAGYTNLCCFACVEQSALGFVTRFGRFVRFAEPGQAAARAPYPPASGAVTSPE